MGSKKKQSKSAPKLEKKEASASFSIFNVIESYLKTRANKVFYLLLSCSVVIGLILFDMRISVGGDDSAYIQRAFSFITKGTFPFEQGPLYPLMLSPFVKIFGINLFVLKLLSLVFLNLAFVLTYKSLKERIPYTILFLLLGFLALNPFYQYFASVTYNEAFFLLIQSIAIYFSLRLLDTSREHPLNFKLDWKIILLVAFTFLLVSLTKTVAIICILPLFLFFLLNKKWDYLLGILVAFIGFKMIYEMGIQALYLKPEIGQFRSMFLIDAYKPQLGYEGIEGMLTRFMENANTYLSTRFFSILYLRSFNENLIAVIPNLTAIVSSLIVIFAFLSYKQNKVVFFISLYVLSLSGAVFFGIQAKNMQWRLIIIIVPYLMLLLLFGFYYLARNILVLQIFFLSLFGYIIIASLFNATTKSAKNFSILKENFKGNKYAGFTPDWVNYLKASEWCGDSLPPGEGIIARKHSMSFIYANGREFTPIYQVPAFTKDSIISSDSMVTFVKQFKCKYVILAQLRANPAKKDGQIVNTINVIMGRIHDKYPEKFKLLHAEGNDEMAEVYEMLF